MSYKVLIFKPNDSEKSNLVLWKAQINPPKNYNSIATVLISDNIAVNNRRTEEEWEKLLTENGFKFELNYDSQYAKQYIIFDVNCVCFEFEKTTTTSYSSCNSSYHLYFILIPEFVLHDVFR